jgi:uncharacterized RDD family membrane protein YckC
MEQQQDLLLDLDQHVRYTRASTGARFANYLIDVIVFNLVSRLLGHVISFYGFYVFERQLYETSSVLFYIFMFTVAFAQNAFYYTILEGATKGLTVGKLVTGTRVVRNDGSPITMTDALLRSLSRMVPFEPFSALTGYPWHDSWTKTEVVKVRR